MRLLPMPHVQLPGVIWLHPVLCNCNRGYKVLYYTVCGWGWVDWGGRVCMFRPFSLPISTPLERWKMDLWKRCPSLCLCTSSIPHCQGPVWPNWGGGSGNLGPKWSSGISVWILSSLRTNCCMKCFLFPIMVLWHRCSRVYGKPTN